MCGIQTLDKNWTYLSVDNNMRLRFVFRTSDSLLLPISCLWLYEHRSRSRSRLSERIKNMSIDRAFSLLSFFCFSFILADKAVGQMGFKATWTEVSTNTDCQNQFLCGENKYCIAESLRCNNIRNCGPNDTTDEENCKFRNR